MGAAAGLMAAIPGAAHAQEIPIGTTLGLPFREYTPFLVANLVRQKNVNFMHISQFIAGSGNNAVVTANVNQNNNTQASPTVFIPAPGADQRPLADAIPTLTEQINSNDQMIEQTVIGSGNNAVVQTNVNQENHGTMTPGRTRFFQAPVGMVAPTVAANSQANINNSHVQQFIAGSNNTAVAMLNTNQSNNLTMTGPAEDVQKLLQINVNVQPITQVVIGDNNNAVVQTSVNQQNSPG
jgi:hypothetical protein